MITAVLPQSVSERAVSQPAVPQSARPRPPAPRRACPRPAALRNPGRGVRLTRRGHVVAASAAALLVTAALWAVAIGVGAGAAQATSHAPSRAAVDRNLTQVTVHPGQSLWSVAEAADPGADTRVVIQQIIELNALTGTVVFQGERLWVPRQ